MKTNNVERVNWLDVGVGIFALSVAIGAALFLVGRSGGGLQSRRQFGEKAAEPGVVLKERHKNVISVAAR